MGGRQFKFAGVIFGAGWKRQTYLVDLFYECLPFLKSKGSIFIGLCCSILEELECLQGVRNPLDRIAVRIAEKIKVLIVGVFSIGY